MLKKFKKQINNEKGLTLIELLAVIVILAIIAAIAIPAIGNIIENSRYNAVKADATNVLNAANLYFVEETEDTTVTVKDLVNEDNKLLESAGKIPADENSIITKGSPNTLTTEPIVYSWDKTVIFTGASIDNINGDDEKGSTDGDKTIDSSTGTTP